MSVLTLKLVRRAGCPHMPTSRGIFRRMGIFPIVKHYYDPLFDPSDLRYSMAQDRNLAGLDMNDEGQLALLHRFSFAQELDAIPVIKSDGLQFYYHNGLFESGDAEYWYNMIRIFKPGRIIEVGSGYSTLIARMALDKNRQEDSHYTCLHTCIEPYERHWLEKVQGVQVVRKRVEEIDLAVFQALEQNDILFIDSSHVLRAQGDVEYEFLHILPNLKSGVLVHVHDIFTPKDNLFDWDQGDHTIFHNEQYVLEAFLSFNKEFKIVGAVNYLRHHYPQRIAEKCPILGREIASREPGSFWIQRV